MVKKEKPLKVKFRVHGQKALVKLFKLSRLSLPELIQKKDGTVYFEGNKKIVLRLISFKWNGPEYKEYQETKTKKKGTLGRAAAGGLLAGPVGALAGATTAKTKSETQTYTEEQFNYGYLYMVRLDTNEPVSIALLIKSTQAEVIQQMFEYAGIPLEQENEKAKDDELKESVTDPVSRIREYKQLLDEGIITQEEFDAKKRQLLDITE